MAKAKKLSNGRWQMQVYLGRSPEGKTVIKTVTADTRAEVKAKAADVLLSKTPPTRDTVGVAVDQYIISRKPVLSPSTIRGYRTSERLLRTSCPALCNTRLHAVTGALLQESINRISAGHSPKTTRNAYGLLSAALKYKKLRLTVPALPQKVRFDISVPSEETARRVFEAVKGTDMEIPIILAAAGLRRGEICALRPEDFEGDVVHISRSMVFNADHKWVLKAPKTYLSDRYVELPPGVADLVREQGFVTHRNPDALSNAHARLLDRIGVDHFRLHDWRHFMVSVLHARGCSDAFIQQRGGWSSEYTMKNVYRHTLADHQVQMSEIAVGSLSSLLAH